MVLVKNDKSYTNDFTEDLDLTNYKVVECDDGICKQTQGYIKKSDGSVYAFVSTNNGISAAVPTFVGSTTIDKPEKCTEDYVGMLYNINKGVCVSAENGIAFADAGTEEHRMILKKTAVSGTPFNDRKENIPVRVTGNYILKDQFYNGGKY